MGTVADGVMLQGVRAAFLGHRRKRAEVFEVQEEKQQDLWLMDVNGTLFIVPDSKGLITFVLGCSSGCLRPPCLTLGG